MSTATKTRKNSKNSKSAGRPKVQAAADIKLARGQKRFPTVRGMGVTPGEGLGDELLTEGMVVVDIPAIVANLVEQGAFRAAGISQAADQIPTLERHYHQMQSVNWNLWSKGGQGSRPAIRTYKTEDNQLCVMTAEVYEMTFGEAAAA